MQLNLSLVSPPDPRSANWPLMHSPFPILTILVTYIYFVKVIGPKYMKDRKPFKIEKLIILYNILMVLLSAFFFFYVSTCPCSRYCLPFSVECNSEDHLEGWQSHLLSRWQVQFALRASGLFDQGGSLAAPPNRLVVSDSQNRRTRGHSVLRSEEKIHSHFSAARCPPLTCCMGRMDRP